MSPLSAKFSSAHFRAFLLLLEKSRATPIVLSFAMFFFFCVCVCVKLEKEAESNKKEIDKGCSFGQSNVAGHWLRVYLYPMTTFGPANPLTLFYIHLFYLIILNFSMDMNGRDLLGEDLTEKKCKSSLKMWHTYIFIFEMIKKI